MSLYNKIKKYINDDNKLQTAFDNETIRLQDDMIDNVSNPYIAVWTYSEKSKPTQEELDKL
tara:strand:- start:393 stop:575 length:183 start_codon:yes stop_codon:yes gene_type:complete